MFKQTVRLFVKALIIGTLLSLGLQQVSGEPLAAPEPQGIEQSLHLLNQARD